MRVACLAASTAVFLVAGANGVAAQTVKDRIDQSFGSGYVKAEAVIMKRSDPNSGTIVASNPGQATTFISGDDFDFDFEPGFDGAIGLYIAPNNAIELRTLQFGSSADFSTVTAGAFIGAGFTGPSGTLFDADYDTDLESWEASWRYQVNDHLTLLAGPRAIKLDDAADFRLNGGGARGLYEYRNELLGAQIGAEISLLPQTSKFSIDLSGKIGAYKIHSEGGINEYSASTLVVSYESEVDDETFAGELGLELGYRPAQNILVRAGYRALFVSDAALASDNASHSLLDPSLLLREDEIQKDDIFFHGATFGVSIVW
jgi:hypothetical protein